MVAILTINTDHFPLPSIIFFFFCFSFLSLKPLGLLQTSLVFLLWILRDTMFEILVLVSISLDARSFLFHIDLNINSTWKFQIK